MHRQQLGAVGKGRFDLHARQQAGHARLHVARAEQRLSQRHQVGHAVGAVADGFHHLHADQRDGFGVVEAQAPRQTVLREAARLVQLQVIDFAGTQVEVAALLLVWLLLWLVAEKNDGWRKKTKLVLPSLLPKPPRPSSSAAASPVSQLALLMPSGAAPPTALRQPSESCCCC